MSRHRFNSDDIIEAIADERGCHPEEIAVDNIEMDHHEIVVDVHETNPLRDDQ